MTSGVLPMTAWGGRNQALPCSCSSRPPPYPFLCLLSSLHNSEFHTSELAWILLSKADSLRPLGSDATELSFAQILIRMKNGQHAYLASVRSCLWYSRALEYSFR